MDESMAKTASLTVILAGIIAACACDRAAKPTFLNRIEGASYGVPAGWKESMVDGAALLQAPEQVGMYSASIIVSQAGKAVTRESAEKSYATIKGIPYNKISPLEATMVAGAPGWTYSRHYVDKIARTMPRPKTGEYPLDVEHVETKIVLDVGGATYHIRYNCPVALNEKYKPDFERFLTSLKFDAKQP